MDLGLAGRHVVVAGAARGLGFAVVSQLLAEGSRVTAIGRTRGSLESALGKWSSTVPNGEVRTVVCDLSKADAAQVLAAHTSSEERIDGLIVVAGNGRPTERSSTEAMMEAQARNVMPALITIDAFAPLLSKSSVAAAVITTSIAGVEMVDSPAEYAAAKASLHAYVAHWSRALKPIRVNGIAPGNMLTEGSVWASRMENDQQTLETFLAGHVTLGRLGDPREVARVAVFLVSSAASFVTGTTVVVDGGQVRRW